VANLDVLLRGYEGFNRGNLSDLKDDVADDVEWGAVGAFPGLSDLYRGRDGLDEWMETVRSSFESLDVSFERVLSDEGDTVAVAEHLRGRGRESGAEVEMRVYSVYRFEDGVIVRREAFTSEDEALAAART
jgi:ketosteroid isomerase-like protein